MHAVQEPVQLTGSNLKIAVNGITICYDDYGKSTIPIIFLHGFPFDKSSWEPQMTVLKKKYRVLAFDIRGFGKSTAGNEKLSIDLFANDLINFMDALEIDKAIVCGLSMGGYILLNAVKRFPERFAAIILSDTQCVADSPEIREKRRQAIIQIKTNGLNNFAKGFIKNVFCQESLDKKKEVVEKINKIILSTSFHTITGTLQALSVREGTCTSLSKISILVLILCGKEDMVILPEQAEYLHDNISKSKLGIIDRAGHMANLEQPAEFNQHISGFISEIL